MSTRRVRWLCPLIPLTALAMLGSPARAGGSAQSTSVPFVVCKESATWTRPTADQQAHIWEDPRYAELGANAYEWTHDFIVVALSTGFQSQVADKAGLWMENVVGPSPSCAAAKRIEEWVGTWILLHRVISITADGSVYTIIVEATGKGYQSIVFKRVAPTVTFRFVDMNGLVLGQGKAILEIRR